MRADLEIIQDWIPAGSRVLDLGCGNGELLASLRDLKQVTGYGLEIDADNITECVRKGINVIEQDLDKGLGNFASNSFDIVVMTHRCKPCTTPTGSSMKCCASVASASSLFRTSATGVAAGTWPARGGCRSPNSCLTPGTTRRTFTSVLSKTSRRCAASAKHK